MGDEVAELGESRAMARERGTLREISLEGLQPLASISRIIRLRDAIEAASVRRCSECSAIGRCAKQRFR